MCIVAYNLTLILILFVIFIMLSGIGCEMGRQEKEQGENEKKEEEQGEKNTHQADTEKKGDARPNILKAWHVAHSECTMGQNRKNSEKIAI